MANPFKKDLVGKTVVLNADAFDEAYPESERICKVVGGFGSNDMDIHDPRSLSHRGGALYVEWPDGTSGAFRGMDVEKLVEN